MLDIKYLRENIAEAQARLKTRGAALDLSRFVELDEKRRSLLKESETLKQKKNTVSEEIGRLKKEKKDAQALLTEMQEVSARIKGLDSDVAACEGELDAFLLVIPNLPHRSVPVGKDEKDNLVARTWGVPGVFAYKPLEHTDIGERLGIIDTERAGKLAGARFTLLKGAGALLERALINFMLDLHTNKHGYTEVMPPLIVKRGAFVGTGQLPKFEEDLFKIEGWDSFLIPTAEVPVTNIHNDEILVEESLPLRYTAYTPCFRKEAGSYGKDVKGLIRQHQFNKVELVKFCAPEASYDELEKLTADAEEVLQLLNLPYRVVTLCTGDMGFSAAKTYDIEVWLPGQNMYREISSCSICGEFQARRMNARYRTKEGRQVRHVHTLNGSGVAVGRALIAVMETYQQEDGSILVPDALRRYMGGLSHIGARS